MNEVLLYAIKITKQVIESIIPQSIDNVRIITKVKPDEFINIPNVIRIDMRGIGTYSDIVQLNLKVDIPDYFMFFDDFDRKEFEKYFTPVIKQHIIELYIEFTQAVKEIYEYEN